MPNVFDQMRAAVTGGIVDAETTVADAAKNSAKVVAWELGFTLLFIMLVYVIVTGGTSVTVVTGGKKAN